MSSLCKFLAFRRQWNGHHLSAREFYLFNGVQCFLQGEIMVVLLVSFNLYTNVTFESDSFLRKEKKLLFIIDIKKYIKPTIRIFSVFVLSAIRQIYMFIHIRLTRL